MEKHWYIVHAYSNFERKVAEAIKERAATAGLEDVFEEVHNVSGVCRSACCTI